MPCPASMRTLASISFLFIRLLLLHLHPIPGLNPASSALKGPGNPRDYEQEEVQVQEKEEDKDEEEECRAPLQ